jgi:hypothetical protein
MTQEEGRVILQPTALLPMFEIDVVLQVEQGGCTFLAHSIFFFHIYQTSLNSIKLNKD